MLELMLAACCLLTLLAAVQAVSLARQQRALALQLRRVAIHQAETRLLAAARKRLADVQELTEAALAGSTTAVRSIHRGIAAIPFTILENIPATRDTTKLVRGIHDLTADTVYGAISAINRALGSQLRQSLKPNGQDAPGSARLPPKEE
ncbi:MAG: hypothetical protein ACRETN_03100 [Nevskiales bacterium]